jgi:hypothetical protein
MEALGILHDAKVNYDVDYDTNCICFSQIAALELSKIPAFKNLFIKKKRYLKEVGASVDEKTGKITYNTIPRVTTSTAKLLEKIQNTRNISVIEGVTYYPGSKAFWIYGLGYFKFSEIPNGKAIKSEEARKIYELIKKLSSEL